MSAYIRNRSLNKKEAEVVGRDGLNSSDIQEVIASENERKEKPPPEKSSTSDRESKLSGILINNTVISKNAVLAITLSSSVAIFMFYHSNRIMAALFNKGFNSKELEPLYVRSRKILYSACSHYIGGLFPFLRSAVSAEPSPSQRCDFGDKSIPVDDLYDDIDLSNNND